jgi:transcriptional regulator with XRE-family HTH domain
MAVSYTPAELAEMLGEGIRRSRLDRNLEQQQLAAQAGVSVRALQDLEAGKGSSVNTLVRVIGALGKESWVQSLGPVATINPLTMSRDAQPRQRARKRKAPHGR